MKLFVFYLVLFSAGLLGAAYLVGRKFFAVKSLGSEEKNQKLADLPPFFDFLQSLVYEPCLEFWNTVAHPAILKAGEKTTKRSRLVTLKIESALHRLSENFRGRRIAIKNGNGSDGNGNGNGKPFDTAQGKNAEFWNEINEFKKELQNGNGKEKKSKNSPE